MSSDDGLSNQWAVDNNVHNLLNCHESKAAGQLLRMLDSKFGVKSNFIESKKKRINGKQVRIYKADTIELEGNPLYMQSIALVNNNADTLSKRLKNISDYVTTQQVE